MDNAELIPIHETFKEKCCKIPVLLGITFFVSSCIAIVVNDLNNPLRMITSEDREKIALHLKNLPELIQKLKYDCSKFEYKGLSKESFLDDSYYIRSLIDKIDIQYNDESYGGMFESEFDCKENKFSQSIKYSDQLLYKDEFYHAKSKTWTVQKLIASTRTIFNNNDTPYKITIQK